MRYRSALIVAVLFALAGCSTSYDPNAPMADPAEVRADDVQDWMDKVCGVIADAGTSAKQKPPSPGTDFAAAKTGIVTYLTKTSESLAAADKRLEELADGPAPGSKRLVKDLRAGAGQFKAAIDSSVATAQAADPADPTAFVATFKKLADDLQSAQTAADLDVKIRAEFADAQHKAPNCQKLTQAAPK
ncbi:hypothetical protein [Actinokineospora sp. HUAS TT18]|uniref:hypothetical protein n=1 Tax=Actinokineospora sp. HUAS TT18 TaxID=3447451 RepID=UPI003F524161